jgi:hypothetical protein
MPAEENFIEQFTDYKFENYGYVRLPSISISDEERAAASAPLGSSNLEFLTCLARAGFTKKIQKSKWAEYAERVKKELALFDKLGFVDYVLLVWKVTSFCDRTGIARDYGRGSAGGSLVFYLLGITANDPIRYGLFFERFVSETRAKKKIVDGVTYIDGSLAPDVDIDIEQERRKEVVAYLHSLYPKKVCKISTLSTLSGKVLIKDIGKIVCGYSDEEMKTVSDMIPKKFGVVEDLEKAKAGSKDFNNWAVKNPEAYDISLRLRDIIRNRGTHPSGYVVSFDEVAEFLPLEKAKSSEEEADINIATSLTMDEVAYLTLKLDLLGVRCCSVVSRVMKSVGIKFDDVNIHDDPVIYDNLQNLNTAHGIFQLEAPTNLKVCREVKPKNLTELADVVAIARPGALSYLEGYAKNNVKADKVHHLFAKILAATRNVCLYQEQMMQLANAIGFSLEQAEVLRRVVGKKKINEVKEWEQKISEKIKEQGLPEELGSMLWKILEESASYSFNKCLSPDTVVETPNGDKMLFDIQIGDEVLGFDTDERVNRYVKVLDKTEAKRELFEVEMEDGKVIKCSMEHKLLCDDMIMRPLRDIISQNLNIVCRDRRVTKVKSYESIGFKTTLDLEVAHKDHNFYADGLVVSNSHSVAYASLSALTTYLKFKYPKEFFCALLQEAKNEPKPVEEITKIQMELRNFGIKLLPPNILKSEMDFTIEGPDIRFGLSMIKGISDKSIAKLNCFRDEFSSKFEIFEAANNAGLTVNVLAALIQSGCFDGVGGSYDRPRLVWEAQVWNLLTDREKKACIDRGEQFKHSLSAVINSLASGIGADGKPVIKPSRMATIKKKSEPFRAIWEMNRKNLEMANFFYERMLLGYSYSHKLSEIFDSPDGSVLYSVEELNGASEGERCSFVAVVSDKPYEGVAQNEKKTRYARWQLSDETGTITALIFATKDGDKISGTKALHDGSLPAKDSIVFCSGKKHGDSIFLDRISDQSLKIYCKFKDVQKDMESNNRALTSDPIP